MRTVVVVFVLVVYYDEMNIKTGENRRRYLRGLVNPINVEKDDWELYKTSRAM